MKKLSVTVKTLIACVLATFATSCDNKQAATPVSASNDSCAVAAINIRYIDADSVISAYKLAQELMEEQQRELNKLQQWHQATENNLNQLAAKIQSKQQNNAYLTQESFQSDMQDLQNKSQAAERDLAAKQQKLANNEMAIRARLADSLNSFVRDYNAIHNYDAILLREAGVFFKPELNISGEVIEGLNARLEASK
ncbi:MAG: OmpH family outer membrane protein [Muribaculaceae bacterium]|nr:OmpH family outer membrane protein [Muribaculaceae bacterium]